jgi:hypothetical protein
LQRVCRGGFLRRFIHVFKDYDSGGRRGLAVIFKVRRTTGTLVSLDDAARRLLLCFMRRLPSIRLAQHVRARYRFVSACAVKVQATWRSYVTNRRYGPLLLERKRARHEGLLARWLSKKIEAPLPTRVRQLRRVTLFERLVCRNLLQNRTYSDSVRMAEEQFDHLEGNSGPKALTLHSAAHGSVDEAAGGARAGATDVTIRERIEAYTGFCNRRMIEGLHAIIVSDSDDNSIDEELLQGQARRGARGRVGSASATRSGIRSRNNGSPQSDELPNSTIQPRSTSRGTLRPKQKRRRPRVNAQKVVDRLLYSWY